MNYYNEIKNKLIDNEVYSRVKDYSKEKHKVITYFEIGKLLNEAGGKYGDNIIDEYSKKLVVEVGKKYNRRTLFRMKQFYNIFNDEKVSPMVTQLTWSHYIQLLSLKNEDEIIYYINTTINNNLNKRELQEKINRLNLERAYGDLSGDTKYVKTGKEKAREILQTAGAALAIASTAVAIYAQLNGFKDIGGKKKKG